MVQVDVDKSKSLIPVVMICSKSVPICNRFHTIRANGGKITIFLVRVPLTPSFEGNPFSQGHKILSLKTRVLGAAHGEDFVILVCTVLIGLKGVTDRRTPRSWLKRAPKNIWFENEHFQNA